LESDEDIDDTHDDVIFDEDDHDDNPVVGDLDDDVKPIKGSDDSDEVTRLYEEGREHLEAQRYQEAINSFEAGLRIDAHDIRCQNGLYEAKEAKVKADTIAAHYEAGQMLMRSKRFFEAIISFESGLAIDSEHVQCQEGLRDARGAKAKAEAVAAYYEEGIAAFEKGKTLAEFRRVQSERFSDAISAFEKGLFIDSTDVKCQQGLQEAQKAKKDETVFVIKTT
jgi:tetratricopeptide (TPR) repeat protein